MPAKRAMTGAATPEPEAPPSIGADAHDTSWDEEPGWQRKRKEVADPGLALEGLSREQIRERHLAKVNELIELTAPLATEFLTAAREVSPAAHGSDKLINMGCKLVGKTDLLIKTSAKLTGS